MSIRESRVIFIGIEREENGDKEKFLSAKCFGKSGYNIMK